MTTLKNLYNKLKDRLDKDFFRTDITHSKINECEWLNHIYSCPSIRYGHLEYFKSNNDAIEVVHSVFYPSYYKALPVLGYDVISLGGKVSGVFFDFTPCPYHDIFLQDAIGVVKNKLNHLLRPLPEWVNFMSPEFLMITPKEEYEKVEDLCNMLFEIYTGFVKIFDKNNKFLNWEETKTHINGQNRYSEGQRKNMKTQKALAKYIGDEASKTFIDSILFPVYNYK